MKKIFITAIGGDIGYGVIKSLKKGCNELYIIGCDIQKYNCSYDLVNEFYISPPYKDEEEWIEFALKIINKHGIEFFWPITEQEIKLVHKYRSVFKNSTLVINNKKILDITMDKGKTAHYLQKADILTPSIWHDIPSCGENFPLIVKEKFSCGSHSVSMVQTHDELVREYNHMKDPIIQTYVGNVDEEYSMTVFSDGNIVNSIAFKRILGFGSLSKFVELVHDKNLEVIAEKLVKLFKLHGSINVQMRKVDKKYYIFEINPRISSTMGFRLQLGFNDAAWWIDMLEGKKINSFIPPVGNIYGIRCVEEKMFYK